MAYLPTFAEIFLMISPPTDEYFMRQAMLEAQKAFDEDEVPIGAVVVSKNKIIARAHNMVQRLTDVTAHAEMQAITAAENFLGSKYLTSCTIYITLEPCVMCAGALYWSQIARMVYAAPDLKRGFSSQGLKLHPKTEIFSGLLEAESVDLVRAFFLKKRD